MDIENRKKGVHNTMKFEKPTLTLVKFDLEDILTTSGTGSDPSETGCPTFDCGTDTGEFG